MTKKSNLSAIFDAVDAVETNDGTSASEVAIKNNRIQNIELSRIYVNPSQIRRYFDPDEQEKLKNTIQQNGFKGSILLRPLPTALKTSSNQKADFELIYGESRFRAVRELGHETIPAIIQNLTDSETRRVRLDENLIRKDLNPLEEVEGLLEVAADELEISTQKVIALLDEIANAASRKKQLKSDTALQAEKLQSVLDYYKKGTLLGFRSKLGKLQRLPEDIKQALHGQLAWSKAIEIAPVKDVEIRSQLLNWAIEANPSIAQIRQRRKELERTAKANQLQTDDPLTKVRFYKGLEKVSKSDAWSNPELQDRIENLIQEIENIFHIKIS